MSLSLNLHYFMLRSFLFLYNNISDIGKTANYKILMCEVMSLAIILYFNPGSGEVSLNPGRVPVPGKDLIPVAPKGGNMDQIHAVWTACET